MRKTRCLFVPRSRAACPPLPPKVIVRSLVVTRLLSCAHAQFALARVYEFLNENDTDGLLYLADGNAEAQKKAVKAIMAGSISSQLQQPSHLVDSRAMAAAVKQVLLVHEPITGYGNYESFLNSEERGNLNAICGALPQETARALHELCYHLQHVARRASAKSDDATAKRLLAAIFAPVILRASERHARPASPDETKEASTRISTVAQLIALPWRLPFSRQSTAGPRETTPAALLSPARFTEVSSVVPVSTPLRIPPRDEAPTKNCANDAPDVAADSAGSAKDDNVGALSPDMSPICRERIHLDEDLSLRSLRVKWNPKAAPINEEELAESFRFAGPVVKVVVDSKRYMGIVLFQNATSAMRASEEYAGLWTTTRLINEASLPDIGAYDQKVVHRSDQAAKVDDEEEKASKESAAMRRSSLHRARLRRDTGIYDRIVKITWPSGISKAPTASELERIFSRFGEITKCGLSTNGRSALVMFASKESTCRAEADYIGPWGVARLPTVVDAAVAGEGDTNSNQSTRFFSSPVMDFCCEPLVDEPEKPVPRALQAAPRNDDVQRRVPVSARCVKLSWPRPNSKGMVMECEPPTMDEIRSFVQALNVNVVDAVVRANSAILLFASPFSARDAVDRVRAESSHFCASLLLQDDQNVTDDKLNPPVKSMVPTSASPTLGSLVTRATTPIHDRRGSIPIVGEQLSTSSSCTTSLSDEQGSRGSQAAASLGGYGRSFGLFERMHHCDRVATKSAVKDVGIQVMRSDDDEELKTWRERAIHAEEELRLRDLRRNDVALGEADKQAHLDLTTTPKSAQDAAPCLLADVENSVKIALESDTSMPVEETSHDHDVEPGPTIKLMASEAETNKLSHAMLAAKRHGSVPVAFVSDAASQSERVRSLETKLVVSHLSFWLPSSRTQDLQRKFDAIQRTEAHQGTENSCRHSMMTRRYSSVDETENQRDLLLTAYASPPASLRRVLRSLMYSHHRENEIDRWHPEINQRARNTSAFRPQHPDLREWWNTVIISTSNHHVRPSPAPLPDFHRPP